MYKYSIGFRMKFDDIEPEDIEMVVTEYLNRFDRYEIKVTNNLISSKKIVRLLDISQKLAIGRYSLHLLKDALSNPQSYTETKKIIEILNRYKGTNYIYLVTHMPYGNLQECLENILAISSELPENYILLLENEQIDSNNDLYLLQIDRFCTLLSKQNITNIGICLDVGHLLLGFYNEEKTQEYAFIQLEKMSSMISKIKQIHIHDYCKTDHLSLGDGLMRLGMVANFIVKNDLKIPIIIEATLRQPKQEGRKQILLMRQSINNIRRKINANKRNSRCKYNNTIA